MFDKPDAGWTQLKLDNVDECKYCRASYLTDIPVETFNWFIQCIKNPGWHHHLEFDAEGWYWTLTYEDDGKIWLSAPKCEEDQDYLDGKDRDYANLVLPFTIKELAQLWLDNYKQYRKDWVLFDYIPIEEDQQYYIKKLCTLDNKANKLKGLLR